MKKEKEVADQAKEEKTVKGYKGFDKDLKCRNFQYEIGKEFEEQGEPSTCNNGFHYCENPLDVFNYYAPTNGNRFTEVIGKDKFSYHTDDSKVATSKIEIGLEVSMSSLINGAVKFIFSKAKEVTENSSATSGYGANSATSGYGANSATSGYGANSATSGDRANSATSGYGANSATSGRYANSATSGYSANSATSGRYANSATSGYSANSATSGYGANSATSGYGANSATSGYGANSATSGRYANSATSGDRANSATSGYGANSATSGEGCISAALNANGKAKASLGSFIVLAEYVDDNKGYELWKPIDVKAFKVDGKKIKADTYYKLVDGKAKETE